MVCGDQTHIDPADYFSPDAYVPEQPLTSKYFYAVSTPIIGVSSIAFHRYMVNKPIFGGIQLYVLAVTLGIPFGFMVEKQVVKNNIHRDAMIYHYLKTHPENFPPVERVKYKDVLERWFPIRHGR